MAKKGKQDQGRASFTRGPLVKGYYTPTTAFAAIREHVAVMRPDGSLVAVTGPTGDYESEANATLYAVASELYEALKSIVQSHSGGVPKWWNAATAAIAKAEGK